MYGIISIRRQRALKCAVEVDAAFEFRVLLSHFDNLLPLACHRRRRRRWHVAPPPEKSQRLVVAIAASQPEENGHLRTTTTTTQKFHSEVARFRSLNSVTSKTDNSGVGNSNTLPAISDVTGSTVFWACSSLKIQVIRS